MYSFFSTGDAQNLAAVYLLTENNRNKKDKLIKYTCIYIYIYIYFYINSIFILSIACFFFLDKRKLITYTVTEIKTADREYETYFVGLAM